MTCAKCGVDRSTYLAGRGLCRTCHRKERDAGRLDDWPRKTHRSDDLAAEIRHLLPGSTHQIAVSLGMKPGSVARAMRRRGEMELARKFERKVEAA